MGLVYLRVLESFSKGKRTLHWLATRVLLRYMLDTPDYIECLTDKNGKPYLVDFPQRISLTHSFDYAAVMMSDHSEVGIDLELIKPKILRIADKFMKPEEMEFLGAMDEECRIRHLYACWCAKEAVYKLQGDRGVSFRENMTIEPFSFQDQVVLTVILAVDGEQQPHYVHYERFLDYMLGYVMASPVS